MQNDGWITFQRGVYVDVRTAYGSRDRVIVTRQENHPLKLFEEEFQI